MNRDLLVNMRMFAFSAVTSLDLWNMFYDHIPKIPIPGDHRDSTDLGILGFVGMEWLHVVGSLK